MSNTFLQNTLDQLFIYQFQIQYSFFVLRACYLYKSCGEQSDF